MRWSLEMMNQVDNVRMQAEAGMYCKLFRSIIGIHSRANSDVLDSVRLGDTFDSYVVAGQRILCREDHSERAMVEGCDSHKPSTQKFSILKTIAQTVHLLCG